MKIEFKTFTKKRSRIGRTFPTGTIFFTGAQGAGKSLSATHYLERLKQKYPKLYIYSNINLAIADKVIRSDEVKDYILDRKIDGDPCGACDTCLARQELGYFDNGKLCREQSEIPIAFFLDEVQTVLFNSKKSVSFEVFKAICQQRKALKTVIGTMQEFLDLDIRYRRQLQAVVECSHIGAVQFETWKDPSSLKLDPNTNKYVSTSGHLDFRIWKRHDDAYNIYNTFEIVNATMDLDEDKMKSHFTQKINGSAPT